MQAQNLTHAELLSSLHRFANDERQALAGFLLSLIEANRRKLHVREAQTSLFAWLTGTFGFSESAASRRIRVVRLLERLPSLEQEVIIRIAKGRMHLDGLAMVSPHLTEANAVELLSAIEGQSLRAIEMLLALRFPSEIKKPKKEYARPVVLPEDSVPSSPAKIDSSSGNGMAIGSSSDGKDFWGDAASENEQVATSPQVGIELRTTLDAEAAADLARLKELFPGQALKDILGRALRQLRKKKDPGFHEGQQRKVKAKVEAGMKTPTRTEMEAADEEVVMMPGQKGAGPEKEALAPGQGPKRPKRRPYIPVAIRREVYERCQGQCAFVGFDGRRCDAKGYLEIDHRHPFAKGGGEATDNLRVLCRAHNALAAERHFGRKFMMAKRGGRSA